MGEKNVNLEIRFELARQLYELKKHYKSQLSKRYKIKPATVTNYFLGRNHNEEVLAAAQSYLNELKLDAKSKKTTLKKLRTTKIKEEGNV